MNRVKEAIELLRKSLHADVLFTDEAGIEPYCTDKTSNLSSAPDAVVAARNSDDVSLVMKICNDFKVPVIPRGGGSGVTGGAVAVNGGIVLSLERMSRILEIDGENMVAVVEPGAITGDIQKEALKHGLMYPPDPASLDKCSIGGNLAENAGGPRAVKYGITGAYILGHEFVLPGGDIIRTGGKIVKNAAGLNLTAMLVGSEGVLGVVTKIYLRLIPAPLVVYDVLIPFQSLDLAVDAVTSILRSRVVPCAVEFMEHDAIRLVSSYLGGNILFPDAGAHLLIQADGATEDAVDSDIARIVRAAGAEPDSVFIARTEEDKARLWKARRSTRDAIESRSPIFLAEDCSVPRASIAVFLKSLKRHLVSRGLSSIMFGHAGDGNVHIDILKDTIGDSEWSLMIPELKREIYRRAVELGGSITGEHGIGALRREYLAIMMTEAEIELQRRIKLAFDPNGILNPGKILPD